MSKFKPQFLRLLFIDEKIRSGKYPNCSSLAGEYGEVSTRTILRDIDYMKYQLDAPIEYDNSKKGFYYSEPNYHLPAIDIKESDLFAICIAEKALEQYQNTPVYDRLSSVFDKIRSLLPDRIKVNATWIDTQYTFMKESCTMIKPDIWETVSDSLRRKISLRILYQGPGQDPKKRLVDPYHLVNFRGEWYLIAFCHFRGTILTFAVSRIIEADISGKEFKMQDDFDFSGYMGSHFGIMRGSEEYAVKVKFSKADAPYIKERTWHPDQSIKENKDGSVLLSFKTNSLIEVKRWILSWGSGAKVMEPKFLRDEVRKELRECIKLYK